MNVARLPSVRGSRAVSPADRIQRSAGTFGAGDSVLPAAGGAAFESAAVRAPDEAVARTASAVDRGPCFELPPRTGGSHPMASYAGSSCSCTGRRAPRLSATLSTTPTPSSTARVDEVPAWIGDNHLARFLEELAADFRWWGGDRSWQTDDRDLSVSSVFRPGGHVGLTWALRPWPKAASGWGASVITWLKAGEQMTSLAADIRHFLAGERP
ncbi:DUF6228 family protein [Streptomyces sp. NPDC059479]|uniref:DUF6228 family protein n=1 Tax=Streptomyces sp. NPDC059479 TaxID=3346848 RepID=UPI0036765B97